LVIGGGAAGLMCALVAGRRGRRVVVLEHNDRVGKKILISGGGRCNFTNLHATAENYLSQRPDFCKSALARYTPADFIQMVETHGIAYHEKKLGQQFCDTSSREIVAMLLAECAEVGVEIITNCRILSVQRPERFQVKSSRGNWDSRSLVIATGGLSLAKLGATAFGYRLAQQFGLKVTELRPGLVPLTFAPGYQDSLGPLSGLSLPVEIHHRGQVFSENLLLTHRGVSGPAVLQISSYWKEGETLSINLLPGLSGQEWLMNLRGREGKLAPLLSVYWPQRFAESWCQLMDVTRPLAQLSLPKLQEVGAALNAWQVPFASTEGYPKAEVTVGGIDTSELSSKTMEARSVPGLYFIGEVVDVTGWLGGYNFQWAWASGHAAGSFC
jgi:predicted Rossmann fold flavoprotein